MELVLPDDPAFPYIIQPTLPSSPFLNQTSAANCEEEIRESVNRLEENLLGALLCYGPTEVL